MIANDDRPVGLLAGWRRLTSQLLVHTRWMKVWRDRVQTPGGELTYTHMAHPGAVFVVPVTRDGQVVLIRTYRYAIDEWCWEVPAGALHDRNGRSLQEVARAELIEEAGCTGGDLIPLGSYWCANGILRLKTHYFLARDVEVQTERHAEASESISEVVTKPLAEVLDWIREGRLTDGESTFAILLAADVWRGERAPTALSDA